MTNILVIEGASGVGKSTLVRELLQENPDWITPPTFNWPRERNLSTEISGNSVSDYSILATSYANQNSVVVSDRGFLGHWVYQAYKYGYQESWLFDFKGCMERLSTTARGEVSARVTTEQHAHMHTPFRPKIVIVLLHIDEYALRQQRLRSGNKYPYEEANLYYRMAMELGRESKQAEIMFMRGPVRAKDLMV